VRQVYCAIQMTIKLTQPAMLIEAEFRSEILPHTINSSINHGSTATQPPLSQIAAQPCMALSTQPQRG
jgi:hypothetical protein